jgi:hypothetical protein
LNMDNAEYADEHHEPIEGYCVRCKETVEFENPVAVWTRKGMPATRGECPICAGTVFRMGKTEMHHDNERPAAVDVGDTGGRRKQPQLARDTVYVSFAPGDRALAERIAADLNNVGVAAWLHDASDSVSWAGGVHPALKTCDRMVYVLSAESLSAEDVEASWRFFRDQRKPIVIAQAGDAAPPDLIRRSPRFDLVGDYKSAFRQMLQALSQ